MISQRAIALQLPQKDDSWRHVSQVGKDDLQILFTGGHGFEDMVADGVQHDLL